MLLARRISWRLVASAVGVLTVGAIILHPALPHGDRGAYWRVAAHDVRQHPLLGSGAGSFAAVWEDSSRARTGVSVRDAHNLYLETLAETGPFGLALLLGALGLPLALTRRVWDAPLGPSLAAAYLAFLLHAAVDWDWEIPAVVLTGLACAAAVVVQSNLLLHRPGTTP
jgi:O-antigen ligase